MRHFSMGARVLGLIVVLAAFGAIGVAFSGTSALAGQPHGGGAPDPAALAKALAKLDDEWSAAAATRDADRVASFYAEDAIAYPPNEPVAVGREAAKKVWAAYLAEPSFSISWKTVHAEVAASGDLGFTAGTYEDSFKGPDGTMVHETGKYLCTWKRQRDGSWKAIHDMWNTDAK